MSFWDTISNWIVSALPASTTAPVASIGSGTLTVGDIKSAFAGLPALGIALSDILHGTATMGDAETIGEDVLAVASLADPALAPVLSVAATLLPVAFNVVAAGIASGAIKPDPNPIQDAQTTRNFNPGDPAARL